MIVQRYILKELALTFLVCLAGLNLLLMMEKVLRLSLLITGLGASYADVIRLVLLIQPQISMLTLPMAFLLSALLTYGRLGFDNELTVMRSAGMRFRQFVRPLFYLSALLLLVSLSTSIYLMPRSAKELRVRMNSLLRERAPLSIEPGLFFTAFKDILILVNAKPDPVTLKGVFIFDGHDADSERVIAAREGKLLTGEDISPGFSLKDGTVHIVSADGSTEIEFEGYDFRVDVGSELLGRKRVEMSLAALYRGSLSEGKSGREHMIELQRRLSFPLLIVGLAMLSGPLSMIAGRRGRLGGFVIGVVVFTLYYIALIYSENIVRSGSVHYAVCWLPLVILTAAGLLMYRRWK